MHETTFEYGVTRVRDLQLRVLAGPARRDDVARDERDGDSEGDESLEVLPRPRSPRAAVAALRVEGEWVRPTPRFWRSFFHRFGISDPVFRYFSHEEVFARVAARAEDDRVRYCLERGAGDRVSLLAVSNPSGPYITHSAVQTLLQRYGGDEVQYHQGVVSSTHVPRSGEHDVQIGREAFQHRYVLDVPVDGFGRPQIYLSLLRLLCANGAVGYSPGFRSEVSVGKDMWYSLARAMDGFDNGEGFAALRQRFASAQSSWASLREAWRVHRTIAQLPELEPARRDELLRDFSRVTGDLTGLYGLANPDALSAKRQRVLPLRCRVYDLINFVSEVATHHVAPETGRTLQALLGDLVSDEYDLEGTAATVTDFNDFLVASTN